MPVQIPTPDPELLSFMKQHMSSTVHFRRTFMSEVVDPWLAQGHRFVDYHDMLLTLGSAFQGSPLPDWCDQMELGQCYSNCQDLTLGAENLTYYEGLATKPGLFMPLWHAWVVNEDGLVIDPTWEEQETATYFGIPFTDEVITEQCSRTGYDGMIESDWMADGWLLREGWKLLSIPELTA